MSLLESDENTKIKPSVIVLGLDNTHQPSEFWIPETINQRALSFAFYINYSKCISSKYSGGHIPHHIIPRRTDEFQTQKQPRQRGQQTKPFGSCTWLLPADQ